MPTVTRADVDRLTGPQVDAVPFLKGLPRGNREGSVLARREIVWKALTAVNDATIDQIAVDDTLWSAATSVQHGWRAADLEPFKQCATQAKSGAKAATNLAASAKRGESSTQAGAPSPFDDLAPIDDEDMGEWKEVRRQRSPHKKAAQVATSDRARPTPHAPHGTAATRSSRPIRPPTGADNADHDDASRGRASLQQLRGDLRRLAPVLEQSVGALAAIQRAIQEDARLGQTSATSAHASKVDNTLGLMKAVLAGLSAENLKAAIAHAESQPTQPPKVRSTQDSMRHSMPRSWRDIAANGPPPRPQRPRIPWAEDRTLILRPADLTTATQAF